MQLADLRSCGLDIDIDMRYASADNFTGAPVYACGHALLHLDALACLAAAVRLAARQGLRLRLYDAYRPPEAQWKLWKHTPDPDFLAHPERGSPHSRGVAVDVTLIDGQGQALDMGTAFDAFTLRSHHGEAGVDAEAERNRLVLLGIMTTAGWDFYRNEWWHYQLFNARHLYPLIPDGGSGPALMAAAAVSPGAGANGQENAATG
ncbi:MAG: D-alanyl-D-alanine dipeptidase [Geminicoccaceae bacterium]